MNSSLSTERSLNRSAGLIGGLTLISRVLGFCRDILIALCFGTSMAAEAFVVSFKLPNLFRDLVGEGAMNAAIVPVLTEVHSKDGKSGFWKLVWSLSLWMVLLLLIIAAFGVIFAPTMIQLIAPGFVNDPAKFEKTLELTRYIFPFIFFIGISAFLMGILNTLKNFGTSALSSSVLNLSMIVALLAATPIWGVNALAGGILVGGALQCVLQIYSLLKQGVQWGGGNWLHPGVLKIFKLMIPRLWGTAIYQISVFVDTILASFYWIVGDGGQSALYYASRLFQLPLAVFGVSIAQAALPTLSAQHTKGEVGDFGISLSFSIRHVLYYSIPAAIGLAFLTEPIIKLLFERGSFDSYSVKITSSALFYYSLGLASCGVIKILVTAFYALQDTRTPVKTATISLFVNIGLNLLLMKPLQIGGLALATSISATFNALLLAFFMRKKLNLAFPLKEILICFFKALLAASFMALFIFLFATPIIISFYGAPVFPMISLFATIVFSLLIYWAVTVSLKSREWHELRHSWFSKRATKND